MSYILDALKKADRERRPSRVPTLESIHPTPAASVRRRWPWVLAAVIAVNAAIAGYLLSTIPEFTPPAAGDRDVRSSLPTPEQATKIAPRSRPPAEPAPPAPAPATPPSPPSRAPGASTASVPAPPVASAPAPPVVAPPPAAQTPAVSARTISPSPVPPATAPLRAPATPSPGPTAPAAGAPPVATSPPAITTVPPAPVATPPAAAPPVAAPAPVVSTPPPPAPAVAAPAAPAPAPSASMSNPAPATPPAASPVAPARGTADARVAALRPPDQPARPATGGIVAFRELPAAVREALPKLRLEVLAYADRPADRLVFINGQKYVEGGMVEGKVRVEEITQDGAILSHQGQRFLLKE